MTDFYKIKQDIDIILKIKKEAEKSANANEHLLAATTGLFSFIMFLLFKDNNMDSYVFATLAGIASAIVLELFSAMTKGILGALFFKNSRTIKEFSLFEIKNIYNLNKKLSKKAISFIEHDSTNFSKNSLLRKSDLSYYFFIYHIKHMTAYDIIENYKEIYNFLTNNFDSNHYDNAVDPLISKLLNYAKSKEELVEIKDIYFLFLENILDLEDKEIKINKFYDKVCEFKNEDRNIEESIKNIQNIGNTKQKIEIKDKEIKSSNIIKI